MKQLLLGAMSLLLSSGLVHAKPMDERDPVAIITQTSTNILEILDGRRAEFTENPDLLADVVRENLLPMIDVEYSARLILGRAGRGISTEQLQAFSEAMSNVLISRYSDSLIEFKSEESMQVMPMKGKNTDKLTRVRTRIKLENGSFVPLDFAFHVTEKGWKAFDVTVEGISYVITFRNQISPRVQAQGIEKVTAEIVAGNVKFDE